ncbi:MAG: TonB-dependent receptor, partial [Mucilaginibacter sp.]
SVTGRLYKGNDTDLSGYPDWDGKWSSNEFGPNRYDSLWTKKFSQKDYDDYKKKDPTGKYFAVNADSTKIIPTPAAIKRADSLDQANYKKGYNGQSTAFTDPVKDYSVAAKLQFGDFKLGLQYQYWSEGVSSDYVDRFYASNGNLTHWGARQTYFYARYDRNLSERLNFTSFSYYRSSDFGDEAHTTQYFGYANANLSFSDFLSGTAPNFRTNYFSQQSEQFRTDNRVNYVLSEKIDINLGVEVRKGLFQGDYVRSAVEDPISSGTAAAGIKGGNYYSVFDAAVYTQVSYQDRPRKINLSAGGRMDHNRINDKFGYGTVFNPRFSAVYYPGKFIFKGIYSEAFLDASIFNKFSTSAIRLLNSPNLTPERVKNFEFSARVTPFGKNYIQISYYNARYSNILATVAGVVYDTLGNKTTQFQAVGKSRIQGLQAAAEYFITNNLSVFGNATYTNPKSLVAGKWIRISDISDFSANLGTNLRLLNNKLNINLRANIVGDKPAGKNTTVSAGIYSENQGYTVFNGAVSFAFNKMITLQCAADNITDLSYYSPGVRASGGVQPPRVPQPGRVVFLKLIANIGNAL